jgi:hypothetical protein
MLSLLHLTRRFAQGVFAQAIQRCVASDPVVKMTVNLAISAGVLKRGGGASAPGSERECDESQIQDERVGEVGLREAFDEWVPETAHLRCLAGEIATLKATEAAAFLSRVGCEPFTFLPIPNSQATGARQRITPLKPCCDGKAHQRICTVFEVGKR